MHTGNLGLCLCTQPHWRSCPFADHIHWRLHNTGHYDLGILSNHWQNRLMILRSSMLRKTEKNMLCTRQPPIKIGTQYWPQPPPPPNTCHARADPAGGGGRMSWTRVPTSPPQTGWPGPRYPFTPLPWTGWPGSAGGRGRSSKSGYPSPPLPFPALFPVKGLPRPGGLPGPIYLTSPYLPFPDWITWTSWRKGGVGSPEPGYPNPTPLPYPFPGQDDLD